MGRKQDLSIAEYVKSANESDFTETVIELAQWTGWLVHHDRPARTKDSWRTAVQGDAGFPDLVLAKAGRVIFAELKSNSGVVSSAQREWLSALGWGRTNDDHPPRRIRTFVWRPSDMAEIRRVLGADR